MKFSVILNRTALILLTLLLTNSITSSAVADNDNWFKKLAGNVLWKMEVSGTAQILKELGMSKKQIEQFAVKVAECMYQNKRTAYDKYWQELSIGNKESKLEDFIDYKESVDIDGVCINNSLKTLPVEHNIFKD